MLKHTLIHPGILEAIGAAGHGSRILIADGNYPASTTLGPSAELVSLNLMPGVVDACQVLESILSAVPIDFAYVMDYERTGPYALTEDPPAWHDFRRILKQHRPGVELGLIEKWKFYDEARSKSHILTVQTADRRIFANMILDIGVRMEGE